MTQKLLSWYDEHKRELPWRDKGNPYYVYLSEIMLQQTRVDVVSDYFQRFIAEVPDFNALAQLDEEKLLHLWQGLGYYQRARRMKEAAQIIMDEHHGKLPEDLDELLKLPGIGPYTAGALLSIAHDQKAPAMDGNVIRIYARLYLLEGTPVDRELKREVQEHLLHDLPDERCGDFNQALMDLGATICKPRSPLCHDCPLQEDCLAYQEGVVELYPERTKTKDSPIYEKTLLVFSNDGNIGLLRGEENLLQGLWRFPTIEGHDPSHLTNPHYLGERKHIFSHQVWKMKAYAVDGSMEGLHWVPKNKLHDYPMARAFSWLRDLIKQENNETIEAKKS